WSARLARDRRFRLDYGLIRHQPTQRRLSQRAEAVSITVMTVTATVVTMTRLILISLMICRISTAWQRQESQCRWRPLDSHLFQALYC
ncbi:hypothetical protein EV175_005928, partial [Coemansia sp. RSA 1933]